MVGCGCVVVGVVVVVVVVVGVVEVVDSVVVGVVVGLTVVVCGGARVNGTGQFASNLKVKLKNLFKNAILFVESYFKSIYPIHHKYC